MKRDESTYGRVRRKFDEWEDIQANRPPPPRVIAPRRPYTPEPGTESEMGKSLFAGIGFGIGALLLLLGVLTLATAASWSGYGRDGAAVGYTVAGLFLLLSGIGGMAATWNHNYRVLPEAHRRQGHAH